MTTRLVISAAAIALAFAAAPASAVKMASCTQKNMAKADAMLMKMPDSNMNKSTGMNEMKAAKDAMGQKDMNGCMSHLDAAMKAGMSKSM
jgi:hypothetical protein